MGDARSRARDSYQLLVYLMMGFQAGGKRLTPATYGYVAGVLGNIDDLSVLVPDWEECGLGELQRRAKELLAQLAPREAN